jgi:hypothetical protein
MNEGDLISYFVVGVFGFILALVIVSLLRRRERARHVMIEHDQSGFGGPPALKPRRQAGGNRAHPRARRSRAQRGRAGRRDDGEADVKVACAVRRRPRASRSMLELS